MVDGNLDMSYTNIRSLGNLGYVGGNLIAPSTKLMTLGLLKEVSRSLSLVDCHNLRSLRPLEIVGNNLILNGTKVTDLSSLKMVGGKVYIDEDSEIDMDKVGIGIRVVRARIW
jgi:hypothetical protein